MTAFETGRVESADGTVVGYRRLGHGPALILLHGAMQAAQNLAALAATLADEYEVYVPDRRGRGLSGPYGPEHGIRQEVEDLRAVVAASGATRVFGLSGGALVSLRTAMCTPQLTRIALYEPPLSVRGSAPVAWLPRYERELGAGRTAAALATALRGMGTEPLFARVPRSVLVPLMSVGSRLQATGRADVPVAELIPTLPHDMRLVAELADTVAEYAALDADVLLLGGGRSPGYLRTALDELAAVLPRHRRVTFDRLGHSGPDDDGDPARVAAALRSFFAD
ncbi:alpha/beta fold hydrolase [Actinocatenispora rupis]|uniref:Alpha/beta hydrolase n=1 Tax=Actinocatenispora rupis TaxID=519421 RepID=A0A8J3JA44_9ACTN|nr:alpha/beta hydrolase [Actinocatenispora rupis]GID14672.1 alpha/beta hydrolase [Actinocatenispora rupis]